MNGWSFPKDVFEVKNLKGTYVCVIGHNNTLEGEKLKVSAVLTRGNEIAPDTYPLSDVDKDGWVEVLLGDEILPFRGLECVQPKVADLSGIRTPSTPPPPWEREEVADDEQARYSIKFLLGSMPMRNAFRHYADRK